MSAVATSLVGIVLCGALGAVLRWMMQEGWAWWARTRRANEKRVVSWSVGLVLANMVGSCALGALAAASARGLLDPAQWTGWAVGFCGSITTYSAFALEVVALWRQKKGWTALYYALGCVLGGVACAVTGAWMVGF